VLQRPPTRCPPCRHAGALSAQEAELKAHAARLTLLKAKLEGEEAEARERERAVRAKPVRAALCGAGRLREHEHMGGAGQAWSAFVAKLRGWRLQPSRGWRLAG